MTSKLPQRQWVYSLQKLAGTFTITAQVRVEGTVVLPHLLGARFSSCAPRPSSSPAAQSILLLPSHQLHHLQSCVPLVRRHLEPSSIRVSAPVLFLGPGFGVTSWDPAPGRAPALWQQPGRMGAPLNKRVVSVKGPLCLTKALLGPNLLGGRCLKSVL